MIINKHSNLIWTQFQPIYNKSTFYEYCDNLREILLTPLYDNDCDDGSPSQQDWLDDPAEYTCDPAAELRRRNESNIEARTWQECDEGNIVINIMSNLDV